LAIVGRAVYLVAEESDDSSLSLSIFTIELATGNLTHIFSGGTRYPIAADTWLMTAGEQLLLNIGGGHLLSLDVREAIQVAGETLVSP
jgi:hypothetical protein